MFLSMHLINALMGLKGVHSQPAPPLSISWSSSQSPSLSSSSPWPQDWSCMAQVQPIAVAIQLSCACYTDAATTMRRLDGRAQEGLTKFMYPIFWFKKLLCEDWTFRVDTNIANHMQPIVCNAATHTLKCWDNKFQNC